MSAAEPRAEDLLEEPEAGGRRVAPLELFFDLVFVLAITQVTAFLADDTSWGGLARGMLVLAALWWAWVGYSWLTNHCDPDDPAIRIAVFSAMGAMLIAALTVPGAFDDDALLFGVAYFVVRALHIVLLILTSRDAPTRRALAIRLAPFIALGPALIVLASAFDGTLQGIVWLVALACDYGGPLVAKGDWGVSPHHFAERHGLIIIIAIGESIVAVGAGVADLEIDGPVVVAALLGVAVAATLWWMYFDVVAIVAERKLAEARGAARGMLARDSFSYLHLPMVAGIVLFALGVKKTLGHTGDPLEDVPAVALGGGLSLYLLAHVAFRLRNVHTLAKRRVLAAALCAACIPIALEVSALAGLAAVTAVMVALTAFDAIRYREARARLYASMHAGEA